MNVAHWKLLCQLHQQYFSALLPIAPVNPKLISRVSFSKIFEGSAIYHPEYIYDFKLDCFVDGSLLTVHFKYAVFLVYIRYCVLLLCRRVIEFWVIKTTDVLPSRTVCMFLSFCGTQLSKIRKLSSPYFFFARTVVLKHLHIQRNMPFLLCGYI